MQFVVTVTDFHEPLLQHIRMLRLWNNCCSATPDFTLPDLWNLNRQKYEDRKQHSFNVIPYCFIPCRP